MHYYILTRKSSGDRLQNKFIFFFSVIKAFGGSLDGKKQFNEIYSNISVFAVPAKIMRFKEFEFFKLGSRHYF